jgi:DNA polymerase III epsilon subunit-like protein
MNYIVVDFEYNQPFDFIKNEKGKPVRGCPFEIIQIGAVKLDENFELKDKLNLYIKPSIYKRVHPYVEKITKINSSLLKNEKLFLDIYQTFVDFVGNDSVFCFWGSNDFKELIRNIDHYKLDYKQLPMQFINVQLLTSNFLKYPLGMSIGLKNAIDILELPTTLEFHNALNDAIYTAQIFSILKDTKYAKEKLSLKFLTKEGGKKNYRVNTPPLYKDVEKEFGRELTKKEKYVIKKVYEYGQKGVFDIKNKKEL